MKKIFIIYQNKIFNEFLGNFLLRKGFLVKTDTDCVYLLTKSKDIEPDLLILSKDLGSLDLYGFLTKKKYLHSLKNIPVFVIGNLSSKELNELKKLNVKAFIPQPINPYALVERMNILFNIKSKKIKNKTPMLVDINVMNKIFIIQIEANFEPERLDIMIYRIRIYCKKKQIYNPKFFFIFPSLYPETITIQNLDILFSVINISELKIYDSYIKILTKNKKILNLIRKHEVYSKIEVVEDYLTGIKKLNINLQNIKKIPLEYIQVNSKFILDLYDDKNNLVFPASSIITEEVIEDLKKKGIKSLSYFSEKPLADILGEKKDDIIATHDVFSHFENLSLYEKIENDDSYLSDKSAEKMHLFFSKLKGFNSLIISENLIEVKTIKNSLEKYLDFELINHCKNIEKYLVQKKYILIFLDHDHQNPSAYDLLIQIRKKASRRKITVIIIAKSMDMNMLARYKQIGTDYILVTPVTKDKLLNKVHNFILHDRKL